MLQLDEEIRRLPIFRGKIQINWSTLHTEKYCATKCMSSYQLLSHLSKLMTNTEVSNNFSNKVPLKLIRTKLFSHKILLGWGQNQKFDFLKMTEPFQKCWQNRKQEIEAAPKTSWSILREGWCWMGISRVERRSPSPLQLPSGPH